MANPVTRAALALLERKRAADTAHILSALPVPVVLLDPEDRFRYVNHAAEQFLGISTAGLAQLRLRDLVPEDNPLFLLVQQVRQSDATVSDHDLNLESPRINKRGITVQGSSLPEEPGSVLLVLQDASAARSLDRQLAFRGAARSVTGMAAILAHEVKNPLSGIRGAAQLLETSVDPQDRELAVLIRDEADRIRELVDRMEIFGEKPIARTAVNIHRVLEHVRKLAQSGFAPHVRFHEVYDPSLPPVWGNRDQLVQVMLNLVKNAAEAATQEHQSNPEITLMTGFQHGMRLAVPGSTTRLDLPLLVTVRDNGPGIPGRHPAASVRALRLVEGCRQRARACTGRQDHGRSWRTDRGEQPAGAHGFPPASPGGDRRGGRYRRLTDGEGHAMTPPTVLVADDDRSIRTVLTQALGRSGYQVRSTGNAATLWRWVEDGEGDLVITDVVMPDENGLDLIPRIRKIRPELRVVVMSAQSTLLTAVKATQRGAFEYLPKPFDLQELLSVVGRALAVPAAPFVSTSEPRDADERLPLIGRSPAMQEIYRTIARLTTTDLTVMINGESGTGKELVARALHDYGKRRAGPFVAINMAAIPRELIESELFGHERGAFTGATTRSQGRFEQANGGTLFLDEIGDMPPEAQTRLLRVLQEGEFTSVGGRQPIKANVRIIAATHRDLRNAIRQGLFREDLFYRLNVVPIRLPPLRERVEDIQVLARHFLERARDDGLPGKTLDQGAVERLNRYSWPGNVRELENLMRRLAALCPHETIGADQIEVELVETAAPPAEAPVAVGPEPLVRAVERHIREFLASHDGGAAPSDIYDRVIAEVERPLIRLTLAATRGNQIKAAAMLGLNRNTLRKKIRDLDIPVVRGLM